MRSAYIAGLKMGNLGSIQIIFEIAKIWLHDSWKSLWDDESI